jgi:mono/diheme cytochrome c family protein
LKIIKNYVVSLVVAGAIVGAALSVAAQQQTPAPAQPPHPQAAPAAPAAAPGGGAFGAQAQGGSPFPDGPGKEIVSVACTQCHGPNVFTQLRMGEKAWRAQIYDMTLRGAQITPDDIDTAAKYMAKSYGPGVPFPGPPPAKVTLADGQGKELVEGGCALCHGLDRVADTKRTKEQWQLIVNRMVFFGAPISGDQVTTVVDYLATNYSPQPQTAAK